MGIAAPADCAQGAADDCAGGAHGALVPPCGTGRVVGAPCEDVDGGWFAV